MKNILYNKIPYLNKLLRRGINNRHQMKCNRLQFDLKYFKSFFLKSNSDEMHLIPTMTTTKKQHLKEILIRKTMHKRHKTKIQFKWR